MICCILNRAGLYTRVITWPGMERILQIRPATGWRIWADWFLILSGRKTSGLFSPWKDHLNFSLMHQMSPCCMVQMGIVTCGLFLSAMDAGRKFIFQMVLTIPFATDKKRTFIGMSSFYILIQI